MQPSIVVPDREDEGNTPGGQGNIKAERPGGPILGRWKACMACRAKKTRCDGEQPECGPCISLGRPCTYSTSRGRHCGPRSAAVLSVHLEELQEKLESLIQTQQDNPLGSHTTSSSHNVATSNTPETLRRTNPTQPIDFELSREDRDKILAIFFPYRHRVGCVVDPVCFSQTLDAEDESLRPHPALLYGMFLAGIMFANLSMQTHLLPSTLPDTAWLLSQMHQSLEASLEMVDRLFDYIQASRILCSWYVYHGRLQEAQYFSASTFRLTVDCQLHRIDGNVIKEVLVDDTPGTSFWDSTILGRPESRYHLFLRVVLFWKCFDCERMLALMTGLPIAGDELSVTTIWPSSLDDFESGKAFIQYRPQSVQELLDGDIGSDLTEDLFAEPYESKMIVLLGRVTQLSSLCEAFRPHHQIQVEDLIHRANSLAHAIKRFDSTLSQIDRALPPYQSLKSNTDPNRWCLALTVRLGMCAVHIHLLRSVEALLKLLAAPSGTETLSGVDPILHASLMVLAPEEGSQGSFLSARFALARLGIRLVHEVVRQHVDQDPEGFETTSWLPHIPSVCGFILPPLLTGVTEYINNLEGQQGSLSAAETISHQALSVLLDGAEQVYALGMQVLRLLSTNMTILRFQIEKIEKSRSTKYSLDIAGQTPPTDASARQPWD